MEMLQAYYTSCRIGQSAASGFQFYSYSEGLSSEELSEIAKIGNYIPPLHLPSNPTFEDIEMHFPIAFTYFRLKSGRVGVQQSVALPQDYSGRPGNYFSHTLILQSGEFPFLPIFLYKSPVFRNNLSDVEWDISTVPEKLSKIYLDNHDDNTMINPLTIETFLSNEKNETLFNSILNCVIEKSTTNKKIIFIDQNDTIPIWIACLTSSFPLYLSNKITFSTYNIDPSNNTASICATTKEGGRLNLNDEAAYDFKYYIFNILSNKFSQIRLNSIYSRGIGTGLTASQSQLPELFSFFANFNYKTIDTRIDIIYILYFASNNKKLFNTYWKEVLEFIYTDATAEYLQSFFTFNKIILEIPLYYNEQSDFTPDIYFSLLYKIYKRTNRQDDYEGIIDLYLIWVLSWICCNDGEQFDKNYTQAFLTKNESILNLLAENQKQFSTIFFTEKTLSQLNQNIFDTNFQAFFINLLSLEIQNSICCKIKPGDLLLIPSFEELLYRYFELSNHESAWDRFVDIIPDSACFITFVDYYHQKFKNEGIQSVFELFITRKKIDSNELYDNLCKLDESTLLLAYIPVYLRIAKSKSDFWKAQSYLDKRISAEQMDMIVRHYLATYPDELELRALLQLVVKKDRKQLITELLPKVEATFSMEIPSDQESNYILEMCSVKAAKRIKTEGSTFEHLKYLLTIQTENNPNISTTLKTNRENFDKLSADKQYRYAISLLSLLIPHIKSEKDYNALLEFTTSIKQAKVKEYFFESLNDLYTLKISSDNLKLLIIIYLSTDKDSSERLHEVLYNNLYNLSGNTLETYDKIFSKKVANNASKRWDKLHMEIINNKNATISGKLSKFLSNLTKKI